MGQRGRRIVAAVAIALALGAWTPEPKDQQEAEGVSDQLWDRLLSHCGESYFYAGSAFDKDGAKEFWHLYKPVHDLVEFIDVQFAIVPIPVTSAEHLNGSGTRARITMLSGTFRLRNQGKWGEWIDGPETPERSAGDMDKRIKRNDENDSTFGMGTGGAMALEIRKEKGEWLVARQSASTSGYGLMLGEPHFVKLSQFLADTAPKYDCKKAAIVAPPRTPSANR